MTTRAQLEGKEHENVALKDRGDRAQALMDDPIFKDVMDRVRRGYLSAFLSTSEDDDQGRKTCWLAVKVIDNLEGQLRAIIRPGKLASHELDLLEDMRRRIDAA